MLLSTYRRWSLCDQAFTNLMLFPTLRGTDYLQPHLSLFTPILTNAARTCDWSRLQAPTRQKPDGDSHLTGQSLQPNSYSSSTTACLLNKYLNLSGQHLLKPDDVEENLFHYCAGIIQINLVNYKALSSSLLVVVEVLLITTGFSCI